LPGGSRHFHQQMPSGGSLYRHLYAPPSNTKLISAPVGQPSRREKSSAQQEPLSGGSRHVHQQMSSGGSLYRHLYAPSSNTKLISAPVGQPSRREKSSAQQEPLSGGSRHVHQQMPSGGSSYRHLYAPSNTKLIYFSSHGSAIQEGAVVWWISTRSPADAIRWILIPSLICPI